MNAQMDNLISLNKSKKKITREIKILSKLKEKVTEQKERFLNTDIKLIDLMRPKMQLKQKIKKIINVYQPKYNNHSCQGIGDFLRGSFFLLQFCLHNNIEFDMNYKLHNISKYIYNSTPIAYEINHDNINYYVPDNIFSSTINFYYEFISYMNNQKTEVFGCYFNNIPVFKICDKQRNIIKNKFLPKNEIQLELKKTLDILNFEQNKFTVIHIRSGDKCMNFTNGESRDVSSINEYIKFIEKSLPKQRDNYLLLSDNTYIKSYFNKKNSMYKIINSKICHCALNNENGLMDTLVDFFLMTKSKNIISFAFLGHGTGFSEYAAALYNIPYKVNLF